jgi:hypothetical protein
MRRGYPPAMAKAFDTWNVLPHGELLQLADNLLWAQGSVPNMSLKRTMTIARMTDGRLVIHNAIALDEPAMQRIEAFGTPAFLIVPNGMHRLDAPAFKKRYPALKVLAPSGSRKKVEEVIPVDDTYESFPADNTVRLDMLHGMANAEGAMIVTSNDGVSVVLNDAVFNMDKKQDLMGYLITTLFGSAPGPRVSRLSKLMLIKDKKALRADLERYAALPGLERLIVAHEKVAHGHDAADALRAAAGYL